MRTAEHSFPVRRQIRRVVWSLSLLVLAVSGWPLAAQDLVAHRGASHDAPENTLAAFRLAWEQGAAAIEGDFHLSRDGHIVCLHDKDLQRTADDPRRVAELTLAELRELEVGSWKAARFVGEAIPKVLELVPAGKRLFLEIKCGPEILPPLERALATTSLSPDQIVIISFDDEVIRQCRERLPEHRAHWLTSFREDDSGRWNPNSEQVFNILSQTKASGLDTKADPDRVTTALVARLREAGLEFHCWTVDTPALARHFRELGVDSITTNRPAWLRRQLEGERSPNPSR